MSSNSDSLSSFELYSRGIDYLKRGLFKDAEKEFKKVLEIQSSCAPCYFWIGFIDSFLGRNEKAIEDWLLCVELVQDFGEAHFALAWMYYKLGYSGEGYEHVNLATRTGVSLDSVKKFFETLDSKNVGDELVESLAILSDDIKNYFSFEEPEMQLLDSSPFSKESLLSNVKEVVRNTVSFFMNIPRVGIIEGAFICFIIATVARIVVFKIMPIDWNWDSYHHWQIAYYTLHTGLKQGRMWDLTGMEYFWGVIPHLIEAFLLWIFRTSSILPFRVLNMILGSCSSVLVYLIGRESFGWKEGLFAGIIVAVSSPFVVFDITGLGDTVATFLILLSIYLTSSEPFLSGIILGLGCQSRIEFWGIAGLYFLFVFFYRRTKKQIGRLDYFFPKIIGWSVVMAIFFIFFYAKTGNPIYPFYWSIYNVIGGFSGSSAGGEFQQLLITKIINMFSITSETFYIKMLFIGIAMLSMFLYVKSLKKKSLQKNLDIYVTLFSIVIFRSVFFVAGGAKWLTSSFVMLLMIRIFQIEIVLGLILLFSSVSSLTRHRNYISFIIFLLLVPISIYNTRDYIKYQDSQTSTFQVVDAFVPSYNGGTITCDNPNMVYRLIHKHNIKHTSIISNHYSPFYYSNEPSITQYLDWFVNNNITYIFHTSGGWSHQVYSYAKDNIPSLFIELGAYGSVTFLQVNQTAVNETTSNNPF